MRYLSLSRLLRQAITPRPQGFSGSRTAERSISGRRTRLGSAVVATTLALAALPAVASAATTVDTSADPATPNCASGHPSGTCSLRGAVAADNAVVIAPGINPVLTTGEIGIDGDITITGQGARATTLSGSNASRVFDVMSGTVSISALTLTAGKSVEGGALFNDSGGNVTLTDVAVTGNHADIFGGGLLNRGTLTLLRVTVSGNTASSTAEASGGGIANGGSVSATNSTISGNTASAAGVLSVTGGGIYSFGSVTLTNVTLASNTVIATGTGTGSGGNITTVGVGATATLKNTIAAYGTAPTQSNCFAGPGGATFVSQGGNLEATSGQCGVGGSPGDKTGVDPLLATLGNNGGQTDTRALAAASPALDAVPTANCPPPGEDQRQVPRPQGAACDIGAFELQVAAPAPTTPSAPSRPGTPAMQAIRLAASPHRLFAGGRRCVRFKATVAGAAIAGARIHFAGHDATTNRHGKVTICARLARAGHYRARATHAGFKPGTASVRAIARRVARARPQPRFTG